MVSEMRLVSLPCQDGLGERAGVSLVCFQVVTNHLLHLICRNVEERGPNVEGAKNRL